MHPRIPYELVTVPLGPAEHTLGPPAPAGARFGGKRFSTAHTRTIPRNVLPLEPNKLATWWRY